MASFEEKARKLLKRVPKGKLTAYSAIAKAFGNRNAARAVGNACAKNPFAPRIPCHRVVKSNGKIGGYAFGVRKKIALLGREGVMVKKNKVLDFNKKIFRF